MRPRNAATLIIVRRDRSKPQVLMGKRNSGHDFMPNLWVFPGGRIDDDDHSPEFAALRETHEEIGLDRRFIDIVGRMPDYVSGSGYRIAPVLSVVRPGFSLTLNHDEVDAAF